MSAPHSFARTSPGRGLALPHLAVGIEPGARPARTRRIRSSRAAGGILVAGDLIAVAVAIVVLAGVAGVPPHPILALGLLVLAPLVFHRLGLYQQGVTSSGLHQIDGLGRSLVVIGAVLVMIRLLPGVVVVPSWGAMVRLLAVVVQTCVWIRMQ